MLFVVVDLPSIAVAIVEVVVVVVVVAIAVNEFIDVCSTKKVAVDSLLVVVLSVNVIIVVEDYYCYSLSLKSNWHYESLHPNSKQHLKVKLKKQKYKTPFSQKSILPVPLITFENSIYLKFVGFQYKNNFQYKRIPDLN